MERPLDWRLVLAFGLLAALLVANAGLTYRNTRQLDADARWVGHTQEVIDALDDLLGTLRDAETGQRGYLLTGDPTFREPFDAALVAYPDKVERVRTLTADNPGQQGRLARLGGLIDARLGESKRAVDFEARGDHDAARGVVAEKAGKRLMDDIRAAVGDMKAAEVGLLRQREAERARTYATAVVSGLVTVLLALLAVGAVFWLAVRFARHRSEAAARVHQQRELLYATLTSIGDGMIATDTAGHVTLMNPVAELLTGWPAAEAVGRPLTDVFRIVNMHTREPVENPAVKAITAGKVVGLANHTVLIARDGTEWPLDDSAAPIRDADGGVAGAVLVFREVSDRYRVEAELARRGEELRRSEERLRLAVEATGVGIFDYDPATGRQVFSDEALRVWGFPPGTDPAPETVLAAVHPDDRGWVEAAARGSLDPAGPGRFHIEHRVVHPDGSVRWVAASGRTMFESGGERPVRSVGTMLDVTAAKRAEAALKEADRRKDEFLATLAHELRNPLAPIRTGVHLLRTAASGGPGVDRVRDLIERQVNQLVRLVDDLMDLSRVSRGKVAIRKDRVALQAVVRQAVETSGPLIEAGRHALTVTDAPETVYVTGDFVRLAQVVSNLLNNAAKYTPAGGRIDVVVGREGDGAVVRVRDSGVGIPAAILPKVFDMFVQEDRSLGRAQGGLGIGLTLVRQLVEMHGGSVEARSEGEGTGSEFVVRLPVAGTGPETAGLGGGDPPPPAGPPRRVLVVDDNTDASDSLAELLQSAGHDARAVYDGHSAVEQVRAFRPDVVLLDLGMPGMDGYETARTVRQLHEVPRVYLVALTGWGQDADRRRTDEAGFDAHLVKPVDYAVLQRLLAGLPPT